MNLPNGHYWVVEKFEGRFRRSLVRVEDGFGYSMDGDVYDFSDSGMELAKSRGAEYAFAKADITEQHLGNRMKPEHHKYYVIEFISSGDREVGMYAKDCQEKGGLFWLCGRDDVYFANDFKVIKEVELND